MQRLRRECSWKREQTHRSLQRYLLEETHEALEAIDAGADSGDWSGLREELGDVLLQVVFHAVIAEESGAFDLDEVLAGITAKMIRRNPHVFDPEGAGRDAAGLDADAVNELWQQMKAAEKAQEPEHPEHPEQMAAGQDVLPPGLPALLAADKTLERRDRAGRPIAPDPSSTDVGERLLALVAEARAEGRDAEQALRDAVRRHGTRD